MKEKSIMQRSLDEEILKKANEKIANGFLSDAVDILSELVLNNTDIFSVYFELAKIAKNNGDEVTAKKLIKIGLAKHPENTSGCRILARLLFEEEDFDEALAALSPVFRAGESNAEDINLVREILERTRSLSRVSWIRLIHDLRFPLKEIQSKKSEKDINFNNQGKNIGAKNKNNDFLHKCSSRLGDLNNKDIPPNFCVLPWKHLDIQTEGTVKLCCQGPTLRNPNGSPQNVNQQSLSSIWNGSDMRMIRAGMLAGVRVPGCKKCWDSEDNGSLSRRQQVNNSVSLSQIEEIYNQAKKEYFHVGEMPTEYQLNMGTTCNLKCRTCSSEYSSKIAGDKVVKKWEENNLNHVDIPITSEAHQFPIIDSRGINLTRFPEGKPWFEDFDFIKNEIFSNAKKLSYIQIIGGEPVVLKRFLDVLEYIKDFGSPSSTRIGFTTNGTLINEKLLGVLKEFSNVSVTLSFDGIADQFEYIRYPGKWIDFLSSVDKYKSIKADISAIPTFHAYNALNFADLLFFCESNGIRPILNPLRFPNYLAARVLPPKVRKVVIERLQAYCDKSLYASNKKIGESLIREIDVPNDDFDEKLFLDFMHYTNDLDKSREGNEFKKVFSELLNLIETSGIKWSNDLRYAD